MALCTCNPCKSAEDIAMWDGCLLEGGGHTQFFVQKCKECGGILGFPKANFDMAILRGAPSTKKKLAEIIADSEGL